MLFEVYEYLAPATDNQKKKLQPVINIILLILGQEENYCAILEG